MTFHHEDGRPIGAPWAQDWIAREIANANRPPESPIVRAGWRMEVVVRAADRLRRGQCASPVHLTRRTTMADAYLPVWVYDLPADFVFDAQGALREKVRRAVEMRVIRVIAGPEHCHVRIDIKRPYYRGLPLPIIEQCPA